VYIAGMKLSLIVAANLDGVIGQDNQLLWRLPKDLKRFKSLTMGKPILMGRKTFESIGRPLPGRTSIVITRNPTYKREGVIVTTSIDDAINRALETGASESFVIGGGEIYDLLLPLAHRIYFTRVHNRLPGDAYFTIPEKSDWQLVASERHYADENHACDFEFIDLIRRS
jgi:dihydrofolate reductase